jgi:hypothetical protein
MAEEKTKEGRKEGREGGDGRKKERILYERRKVTEGEGKKVEEGRKVKEDN